MIRLGGLAAMLGGLVWVVKSGLILLGIADLGALIIVAQLPFALVLLVLYLLVKESGGWVARAGGLLAGVACVLSLINAPSVLLEETPLLFHVTYLAAALTIFFGPLFLGVAVPRAEVLLARWRVFPLGIGISALLPVWVLAFIHIELPVLVLGVAWVVLGYVLLAKSGEVARLVSKAE